MTWSNVRRCFAYLSLVLLVSYAAAAALTGSAWLESPAAAQTKGRVPGNALGNTSDAELWRQVRRGVTGTVSIPDKKAGVLVQSEGDNWRAIHNGPVSVFGGWALLVVVVVLAIFFAHRGRIRIESGFSGRVVRRFTDIEVFTHWLTASSFVVLGLTGLNVLYGKFVLMPIIGADAFSALALWGKYAHNFLAIPFMVGLVMMVVLWIRHNFWDRYDLGWLAQAGGLFTKGVHPPAGRFNFGQKFIFWAVTIGGVVISATGISLMTPFSFGDIQAMQLTQVIHSVTALVLIVIMIGHIYIGSLGMEGAFDAMSTGQVDENWAREHHSAWEAGPAEGETSGEQQPAE